MSSITIFNKALGLLSATPILSAFDDTKESILFKSQYEIVLNTLLELHPWSFAVRRGVLMKYAEAPLDGFGWKASYNKPIECIRILSVSEKKDGFKSNNPFVAEFDELSDFKWVLEDSYILSNKTTDVLYAVYISSGVPEAYFSAGFVDALSTRLAAELSGVLTDSDTLYEILYNQYKGKIHDAIEMDSNQRSIPLNTREDFIRIR